MANIEHLHDKVIPYSRLKQVLPDRIKFLNPRERVKIDEAIAKKEQLMFLPTYLTEQHIQDVKYQKSKYKIILMGILRDGRRVNVILDGIEPYFEVKIPDGSKESQQAEINKILALLESDEVTKPTKKSIITAKPFRYYQKHKSKFLRLYYEKTKPRVTAINLVRKHGYETTSDDLASYYRVVCRDVRTTFSSWATLDNYTACSIPFLKGETYRLDITNYKKFSGELTGDLLKDKTLSCCWDIETWSLDGEVPMPENPNHLIFCLSMTFQWVHDPQPFLKIALCDYPSHAKPGYLTIVCGKEFNIIKAFSEIFALMRPEFIFGFNDSDYDWNWIVKRAVKYKGLLSKVASNLDSTVPFTAYTDEAVYKYNFKKEHVKVEADTYVDGFSLMMHGYIPVDVRTVFRRIYKTAEQTSLKWFLAKNKLGGKEDMPYERMFKIYKAYREFILMHSTDEIVLKGMGKPIEKKPVVSDSEEDSDVDDDGQWNPKVNEKDWGPEDDGTDTWAIKSKDTTKPLSTADTGKKEVSKVSSQSTNSINSKTNSVLNKAYTDIVNGVSADFDTKSWTDTEKSLYDQFKKDLADINYYCVVDAQRCHDLIKIRSVIMDSREVSDLSFVSVYDAFYRADGMKVRNLTIAVGQLQPFNIRFSNISNEESEEGKYPGAFVFPPRKGLKISKLSMDERIAKAKLTKDTNTKSCQEWLNTSPEELEKYKSIINDYGAVGTQETIKKVESSTGEPLPKHFKDFWTEKTGRPICGLDFSSLYPSLMRAYNFSPEYCILDKKFAKQLDSEGVKLIKVDFNFNGKRRLAYFVWHNAIYDAADPKFQFGVYPYILNDLFNKRAVLKKKMKGFEHRKEQIEAMSKEEQDKLAEEYADVCFNKNYLNSKQNALKVFMNTFYGEAGNKRSPFFVLEVAGGITSYGQTNIKFAFGYVKSVGCDVYYGDSVAGYTPIRVRIDGIECFGEIQDLVEPSAYRKYNDGKEIAILHGYEIWSDVGWTPINHIIRHKTDKQMYRVLTHNSVVDVTADHSLLDATGAVVKPVDAVGKEMLTKEHPIETVDNKDSLERIRKLFGPDGFVDCKSQMEAGILYNECKSLGYNVLVDCNADIYRLMLASPNSSESAIEPKNIVKNIFKLPKTDQYVYDIETGNHHFAAGVGELVVHNTDSLYISMPESEFTTVDKLFYTGKMDKLEYWKKLVEISFVAVNPIRDGVNTAFKNDNGTHFLSMAYEEFLFPVAFTAKKKYFGIAHENIPNFSPRELFIRGLEVKKRGVSDLLRKSFDYIMWQCCKPENLYDLVELVLARIDYIYNTKWSPSDFVQTAVYKPPKQGKPGNVKINTFVARMKERGIEVKPNERFNYVLVKKYPYTYDFRGRKQELSIGDKIEFSESAEKDNLDIDLDYYMQGSLNGQFARLITYHDMFFVEPVDESPDELKTAEDKIYKNACKFIESYCSKYYAKYNTFGKTHQKIYKTASKVASQSVGLVDDLASDLLNANVAYDDFEEWFVSYTEKHADKTIAEYGKTFIINELNKLVKQIKNKYNKLKVGNGVESKKSKNAIDDYYSDLDSDSDGETMVKTKSKSKPKAKVKDLVDSDAEDAGYTILDASGNVVGGKSESDSESDSKPGPNVRGVPSEIKTDQSVSLIIPTDEEIKKEIKLRREERLKDLQKVYYGNGTKSLERTKEAAYSNTMAILRKRIRENFDSIMKLYRTYNKSVEDLMSIIKNKVELKDQLLAPTKEAHDYKLEDLNFELTDDMEETLTERANYNTKLLLATPELVKILTNFKTLYKDMVSAHITVKRMRSIVSYLKMRRDNANRTVSRPSDEIINRLKSTTDATLVDALDI